MDSTRGGFTDEVSSLQPGMHVGNLEVLGFIGKGGLGEVYHARHDILGTEFALKLIPKAFSGEEAGGSFRAAACVQALLDHPSVVRIDDMGEEELFYWMRMEFVGGERTSDKTLLRSLEDLMRYQRAPVAEEEVCYYLYHTLDALSYAHGMDVVHADLKPANVLLGNEGIKLSELGLTELIGHAWDDFHLLPGDKRIEPTPFDPLPGFSRSLPALLATFDYYSPEQRAGRQPDPQSNLFTVGLIAYRMLTGRRCLVPGLPTAAVKGINPRWNDWVGRALAYEPEDRFESAAEMIESMPGLERAEPSSGERPAGEAAG